MIKEEPMVRIPSYLDKKKQSEDEKEKEKEMKEEEHTPTQAAMENVESQPIEIQAIPESEQITDL